jgi:hypothetical protein
VTVQDLAFDENRNALAAFSLSQVLELSRILRSWSNTRTLLLLGSVSADSARRASGTPARADRTGGR